MDRIIGGVLGLAAFAAVVAVSLVRGIPFASCILRAILALVLGYWAGKLVFGKVGLAVVKEAAGGPPPAPKPAAPATPEQAGPPKAS